MKYDITYSCGHTCRVDIVGKHDERARRIKYMEEYKICPACYREQKNKEKSIGCIEVEMKYADYKKEYADCKTKAGSYNKAEKSVVVYVPEKVAEEKGITAGDEPESNTETKNDVEESEENNMGETKKITFKDRPDACIYVGYGEWIFDRIWASKKETGKPELMHGGTFPIKEESYSGVCVEKKKENLYYFDYVSEHRLLEIMLEHCNEASVENVDICKVLKVEDREFMVMQVPDKYHPGEALIADEQPYSYEFVDCPKTTHDVRFLQCKDCAEHKTCKAYMDVKFIR